MTGKRLKQRKNKKINVNGRIDNKKVLFPKKLFLGMICSQRELHHLVSKELFLTPNMDCSSVRTKEDQRNERSDYFTAFFSQVLTIGVILGLRRNKFVDQKALIINGLFVLIWSFSLVMQWKPALLIHKRAWPLLELVLRTSRGTNPALTVKTCSNNGCTYFLLLNPDLFSLSFFSCLQFSHLWNVTAQSGQHGLVGQHVIMTNTVEHGEIILGITPTLV